MKRLSLAEQKETFGFLELGAWWRSRSPVILDYGLVCVPSNHGVGSNTYRALRAEDKKPSDVFAGWSAKTFPLLARRLQHKSTSDFEALWTFAVDDLQRYWHDEAGAGKLSNAHARKLIDLWIKHLAWHGRLGCEEKELRSIVLRSWQRIFLLSRAHVPLDSKLLKALPKLESSIVVKQKSMGDVSDESYFKFQEIIRAATAKQGVPSIALDFFVWNAASDIDWTR